MVNLSSTHYKHSCQHNHWSLTDNGCNSNTSRTMNEWYNISSCQCSVHTPQKHHFNIIFFLFFILYQIRNINEETYLITCFCFCTPCKKQFLCTNTVKTAYVHSWMQYHDITNEQIHLKKIMDDYRSNNPMIEQNFKDHFHLRFRKYIQAQT